MIAFESECARISEVELEMRTSELDTERGFSSWLRNGSIVHDIGIAALPLLLVCIVTIGWTFPNAADDPVRREDAIAEYYDRLFNATEQVAIFQDTQEAREARDARDRLDIRGDVRRFVTRYHLDRAHVLDVGSGIGYLQDVVTDYTGFDIAKSAEPYYHKPFVLGTATAMPFPDHTFDAIWSIWVLEHIPNPEAALREMRRILKPGGYLYLRPAWHVRPWASKGLDARPAADLGLRDRLEKWTIPLRTSYVVWCVTHVPARVLRAIASGSSPSTFHYRRLIPNFAEYWQADSDAVNNLDTREVALWFESRGDVCLTCSQDLRRYLEDPDTVVIRIRQEK
jgi:SAM-dependent methyltransferase